MDAERIKFVKIGADSPSSVFRKLSANHSDCLPDDILPMLGRGYLFHFHRFLAGSNQEMVYVAMDGQNPVAHLSITMDTGSLMRRVAVKTLPFLLFFAGVGFFGSASFRKICKKVLQDAPPKVYNPQVVVIFSDNQYRGFGIAKKLLDHAMKDASLSDLYTKVAVSNVAARNFYRSSGFYEVDRCFYCEKDYLLLRRSC
ncbi:hypothetical protein CCP2SC5_970005 [Azospirillaceae bacterium]